jgi:light-harvesting protein B-800-850 alpha chain
MADVDGQAKIWLVVKPEVGLMWLLGMVTLIAVLVHALLVGQTKWFPAYWEGGKGKVAIEHIVHHA